MSSHASSLSLPDPLKSIARRVDLSPMARRTRIAVKAFSREAWAILKSAANPRAELRQMAAECEHTRPEQAARLRRLASTNWGE